METAAQYSLLVFAAIMLIGGIMGFVKGQSKISLISGLASCLLLAGAFLISRSDIKMGLYIGLAVTGLLTMVFAIRIAKTKKIMPAGVLLLLTSFEEALLLLGVFFKI